MIEIMLITARVAERMNTGRFSDMGPTKIYRTNKAIVVSRPVLKTTPKGKITRLRGEGIIIEVSR